MVIDLVGVLNDGSLLQPGVPKNPRRELRLGVGVSTTIRLTVVTTAGVLVDLSASSIAMGIKRRIEGYPPQVTLSGSAILPAGPGRADIVIAATTFKFTPVGLYCYDVWLTGAGGERNPIIPTSPLVLEPAVVLPP